MKPLRWLTGHRTGLALLGLLPCLVMAAPPEEKGRPADTPGRRPEPGWARRDAQLRLPGGTLIRAIHEPAHAAVPTRDRVRPVRPAVASKRIQPAEAPSFMSSTQPTEVSAYTIHSPPIDGFVPWLAVQATNRRATADEWDTRPSMTVQGNYLTANPEQSYAIGLLDTGAGISVLGNASATRLGLFSGPYNTGLTVAIGGVTGTVDAWVSQPFGLWMAGLGSVDPTTLALDTSKLVGEWNVSTAMGTTPEPGAPDLFTALGSPMTVFYASWIRNDLYHSIEREGTTYRAPDITFHSLTSSALPNYPNRMPLELRPSGAYAVWYWPCFAALEYCPGGDGSPQLPSLILGATAQSLFFAGSVNLSDKGLTANGKTKFMVDTGAQVTVIGSIVAAQLGLNPNTPEFTVEVQGVDGQFTDVPGFYLDTIDIPALGQWLSYTQVPVVLLDVASPEGGTLDGIIGMNLFLRYNFVVRGGGLPNQPLPRIDFEPLASNNADYDGDGDVDMEDFAYLQRCLSGANVPQIDPDCQHAFLDGDTDVDQNDLLLFIECASGPDIPAAPECLGL